MLGQRFLFVVSMVALGAAPIAAVPAAAQGQRTPISFTTTDPNPDIGSGIRLDTDVLDTPAYNTGGYEVWIYFCRDIPENCRSRDKWRRMPVTNELGDATAPNFVCKAGQCTLRVRPKAQREATYTFAAAVVRNGQRVAQSRRLVVTWKKPGPKPPLSPPGEGITLTLTVKGVSCTAKIGINEGKSRRYPELMNRCIRESPNAAQIEIGDDGSAPGPVLEAKHTGLPDYYTFLISWWGGQLYCKSNPCTMQVPGHDKGKFDQPMDYINMFFVGVSFLHDPKDGPRAKIPGTDEDFVSGLFAEIGIDYKRKKK